MTFATIELPTDTVFVNKNNKSRFPKRQRRNKLDTLPFQAWDGEGYDDDTGEHHYMLFGNSSGDYVKGVSLSWRECFPLLIDSADKGVNVIYGGDYDIIMMTRGMPFPKLDRLLHGKPVKFGGYRMQWFRRKYFDLRDTVQGKSIRLYDVMTFFSTSFVNACTQYLGAAPELESMREMKAKRGSFTMDDESVVPYWQSELRYLVELMEKLRELLNMANIKPRGWHGPGAVASALLSSHRMDKHFGESPEHIIDLAERAYYGGRFEQFKVGKVSGVREYDIRSAYPRAITELPSLDGVRWKHETSWSGEFNPYALYMVSWDWSKVRKTPLNIPGPFPWRSRKGNIYYPLKGYKSWYWGVEAANLRHSMGNARATFTVHEGWIPEFPRGINYPFRWVGEMYETRARMKREGNPAQLAVKLGLNSLYGKLAQSKGAKLNDDGSWTKPRWHNIIWAGWITAYTRAQLFSAIMAAKGRTIAVETDAIFADTELDLEEGEGLGQWERTDIETVLYVHSGVYYALNGGIWKLKSRGVEADKNKSAPYWRVIFLRLPESKQTVTATIRRFGTNLRSSTYARWYDYSRSIELPTLNSKRIHYPKLCKACVNHAIQIINTGNASWLGHSYADTMHNLTVPEPILGADLTRSSPFPFPWRKDIKFEWPKEWIVTELERDMEVEYHG